MNKIKKFEKASSDIVDLFEDITIKVLDALGQPEALVTENLKAPEFIHGDDLISYFLF